MSGNGPLTGLPGGLACDDVTEMAGVYVLGALEADEARRVAEHLATCPQSHAQFAELGGVVPALAATVAPVKAPAGLRERVLADYAAANPVAASAPASVRRAPVDRAGERRQSRERRWLSWSAALAAVLVIAILGGIAFTAQQRADREAQRAELLSDAIALMAAPGSTVALLTGSGHAAQASGFAAFADDGSGYVVLTGLPSAPAGMSYQAWYLVGGQPTSAGLLSVDVDGYGLLTAHGAAPGTDHVALTIEPLNGSVLPTSPPIVLGELREPL